MSPPPFKSSVGYVKSFSKPPSSLLASRSPSSLPSGIMMSLSPLSDFSSETAYRPWPTFGSFNITSPYDMIESVGFIGSGDSLADLMNESLPCMFAKAIFV